MTAFDYVATAAYLTALGLAIRWILRRLPGGRATRPPLPYRSRADVLADVEIARACRELRQAIDDYDAARLDTAKQRKENEQP